MPLWNFYRCDFSSSSGADNRSPNNSYVWDTATTNWKLRVPADTPIDLTDVDGKLFMQIDTASTENGSNVAASADINILAAAVAGASTAILGGRFDNSTAGAYGIIAAFGDALIKSYAIPSTVLGSAGATNAILPPKIKLRYDNNSTLAGFCSVFVSFRTKA